MKKLLAFAVVAVAFCAAGEEEYISPITGKPVPTDGKFTIEQYKERDERVLKKTGGFIDIEAKGVSVAVLDGRQKPGGAAVQFADVFGSLSKTNVKAERAPIGAGTNAVDAALSFLKAQNAAYAIAIVEDAALCGLTVMPEDRIAVVNATRFKVGGDEVLWNPRVPGEPQAKWNHGGIPMCWPWFGSSGPRGKDEPHGQDAD